MNEIKSMLKQKGMATKRAGRIRKPEAYLFHPDSLFSAFCHSKKSSKLQNCQSQVENILTNWLFCPIILSENGQVSGY